MMDYYSSPRQLLRRAKRILYPRRCPFCDRALGSGTALCLRCAPKVQQLRRQPGMRLHPEQHYLGGLSGAAAPFRYEGCVRHAILHAKYQGAPWMAVELGVLLAREAFGSEIRMAGTEPLPQKVEGARMGYDCIMPVPPSNQKRGYNVPELIALPLARALGLPLETDMLYYTRKKQRQAGLAFEQRLANVAGALAVRDPEALEGRRVLLVDDVITTGATVAACAQALLAAGAESVFAVSVATVEREKVPDGAEIPDEAEKYDDF